MAALGAPTGFAYYPALDWSNGPDHPECKERLLTTFSLFESEGLLNRRDVLLVTPVLAPPSAIESVHVCLPDITSIVAPSHRFAAGSVLALADEFVNGRINNGFALIRPPGHHSGRITLGSRGFCTINNMAILVQYLRLHHGIRRIAIIDTDVHHGDGTQAIFWNDPDVLFISIHQDGHTQYPGTGFPSESGGPSARGTTINLPLPPGAGDAELLRVVDEILNPILHAFDPEIRFNSAGQDGHFADPLGGLQFTAKGYAEVTRRINPAIVLLEGGYAFESNLPLTHLAIMNTLCGQSGHDLLEPDLDRIQTPDSHRMNAWIDGLKRDVFDIQESVRKPIESDYESTKETLLFYDHPSLYDRQTEGYTACDRCSGNLAIRSKARLEDRREISTVIHVIPFDACPDCRRSACMLAGSDSENNASGFSRVIVQDMQKGTVSSI